MVSILRAYLIHLITPVKMSWELPIWLLPVEYLLPTQHLSLIILITNHTTSSLCCLPLQLSCLLLKNILTQGYTLVCLLCVHHKNITTCFFFIQANSTPGQDAQEQQTQEVMKVVNLWETIILTEMQNLMC